MAVSISDFPMEILEKIFGNCGRNELLTVSAVCHRWAQAVHTLLSQKLCLDIHSELVDKTLILNSSRDYTYLRIQWHVTDENLPNLEELLDICRERFHPQRLVLWMWGAETFLAQFFRNHQQQWLQTLTELHVDPGDDLVDCEVSLPCLKLLSFKEPYTSWSYGTGGTWSLDVPELRELEVIHLVTIQYDDHRAFGSLVVKSWAKLEKLSFTGLKWLDLQHLEKFAPLLNQLKVLQFSECYGHVARQICDKCPNLKDLTIELFPLVGEMPLQISPLLSTTLESLRLGRVRIGNRPGVLSGQAVFPELRRISLYEVDLDNSASLIAPQLAELSTYIYPQSGCVQLNVPQSNQLRTLKMAVFDPNMAGVVEPPSSSVTELYLWLDDKLLESSYLLNYLRLFPNLTHLTLNMRFFKVLDCSFVGNFPKLESFSAHQLLMDSIHLKTFAGLKSLILSNCHIFWEPNRTEPVVLTSLEYFRIEQVTVHQFNSGDLFPILINDRQAPIDMTPRGQSKLFTSRSFKSNLDDESTFDYM